MHALRKNTIVFGFILTLLPLVASVHAAERFDQAHTRWADVLDEYVVWSGSRSAVDYAALQASPGKLDTYLAGLSAVSPKQYEAFTSDERLAFLINAYNAFTLKHIINHYPTDSIRSTRFIRSPWKLRFFELLGEERHLDEIEHEMIRPVFKEPRIHFVLVCAAKGCPPLRTEPYVASRLEAQLEDATLNFMRDEGRNRFDASAQTLHLSALYNWYGEDFEQGEQSIRGYAAPYMADDEATRNQIRNAKRVNFLDYDWSLNDVGN